MNEPQDALEAELESMTPRGVPVALRRRIGESLGHEERPGRAVALWRWGAAFATAACIAIGLLAWHLRTARQTGPDGNAPRDVEVARAPVPDATLGSYKLALARSPDQLDALLDDQAARPLAGGNSGSRILKPFDLIPIP